ncbi:MAG: hypothetical protein KAH23_08060, partial [Kiritimatiellae bacterium]|nr:hypothetical protein [Kiritimatiellia bacterium]
HLIWRNTPTYITLHCAHISGRFIYSMRIIRNKLMLFSILAVCVFSRIIVIAGNVELRIRAGNPADKPQMVHIRSTLPEGVRTNDIIDLDGLALGYDVKTDSIFVHQEVELESKAFVVRRVKIKDIWIIQEEELAGLEEWAGLLTGKLKKPADKESADALLEEVRTAIAEIREEQTKNAIGSVVKAVQHIGTYDLNTERLKRVKLDVGNLENLVLASGQDPGKLMGEVSGVPAPVHDVGMDEDDYNIAIFRIIARNTSPTEKRKVPVRSELPLEIKASDIIDSAGLDVGKDARTGRCYVFKADVEIDPGKEVVFAVKIRDKWNINMPRIGKLRSTAEQLLIKVQAKGGFVSIVDILTDCIAGLDRVEKERGPTVLGPMYVSFYRRQTDRIDLIEKKINRIRAALRPPDSSTKLGFKAKPPSMKSTWLIIYIILGFLAVVSLLFFLRWFGKSQSEQLDSVSQGETEDDR